MLLHITLGTPRKACRHFGICHIALWKGIPLAPRQCLAQVENLQSGEGGWSFRFLRSTLTTELILQHFTPCFRVEAPCPLPKQLGGGVLLPGCYRVEWDAADAVVHFDGHPALTACDIQLLSGGTKIVNGQKRKFNPGPLTQCSLKFKTAKQQLPTG